MFVLKKNMLYHIFGLQPRHTNHRRSFCYGAIGLPKRLRLVKVGGALILAENTSLANLYGYHSVGQKQPGNWNFRCFMIFPNQPTWNRYNQIRWIQTAQHRQVRINDLSNKMTRQGSISLAMRKVRGSGGLAMTHSYHLLWCSVRRARSIDQCRPCSNSLTRGCSHLRLRNSLPWRLTRWAQLHRPKIQGVGDCELGSPLPMQTEYVWICNMYEYVGACWGSIQLSDFFQFSYLGWCSMMVPGDWYWLVLIGIVLILMPSVVHIIGVGWLVGWRCWRCQGVPFNHEKISLGVSKYWKRVWACRSRGLCLVMPISTKITKKAKMQYAWLRVVVCAHVHVLYMGNGDGRLSIALIQTPVRKVH
jgi:hypothetical protein